MKILVLPGDGIGPEVMESGLEVLQLCFDFIGQRPEIEKELVGGASIDERGVPITDEVLRLAREADAVFLGAVGGPKWDDFPTDRKPEKALLALRRELDVWANLRPVKVMDSLLDISPLREEKVRGTDILFVRELVSDVYFGEPRGLDDEKGFNTMIYRRDEVERVARFSFELARRRRKKLVSVDKANVLEVSVFWRRIVSEVSKDFEDVELQHAYVDAVALKLVLSPTSFDVVLCPNLFGDILTDEGGGILGSLGLCPSASLNDRGKGLFEPVHGSAPDIAGRGIANPTAMILTVAMFFEYSLGRKDISEKIQRALERTFEEGLATPDISGKKRRAVGTKEFTRKVIDNLKSEFEK